MHVVLDFFAQVSAATSVLVYRDGKTLARVGVMGESAAIQDAPILRKCVRDGRDGREQYLAALQVISLFPYRGLVRNPYPYVVQLVTVQHARYHTSSDEFPRQLYQIQGVRIQRK